MGYRGQVLASHFPGPTRRDWERELLVGRVPRPQGARPGRPADGCARGGRRAGTNGSGSALCARLLVAGELVRRD